MSASVLELDRLRLDLPGADGGWVPVLRDVSFGVGEGEILGLVGESGAGKSLVLRSVLGLAPRGGRLSGRILFRGEDLVPSGEAGFRVLRGRRIGMVFQEPRAALNPVLTIGRQIREMLDTHRSASAGRQARREVHDLLRRAGMPPDEDWTRRYPHQLSGGQCQRSMIAMTLAGGPDLLLADEPTSALDPTVQMGILDLLAELRSDPGLAVLLVTHDLAVVRRICDRVGVLYAGEIVEQGSVDEVFRSPGHPYTRGLLDAIPDLGRPAPRGRMPTIPGTVPDAGNPPTGCAFHPRCPERMEVCERREPETYRTPGGWPARCFLHRPEESPR